MIRATSKRLFAIVVFIGLGLFGSTPAFAGPGCNLVCEGNYTIDDIDTADDLDALSRCKFIIGNLSISSTLLTSLEGLECLTHIGGYLRISDNDSLTSLAGLENLKTVAANLVIVRNHELCTSFAEALRDRGIDAGGIGAPVYISGNKPGC
jgi:hypothetical protein